MMDLKLELDESLQMISNPKKIIMSLKTFRELLDNYGNEFTVENNDLLYKNCIIKFENIGYGDFIISPKL